jgi:hypothetical protein
LQHLHPIGSRNSARERAVWGDNLKKGLLPCQKAVC